MTPDDSTRSELTRPDAVIFDLDGTLWDAAEATARGWNRGLEEMGIAPRVTEAGIRSVAGTPFDGCVEILLPELCPPDKTMLRSLDSHEKAAIAESGGTLYAGVASGLREMATIYPLFLVSNCQDWYVDLFFAKSGLRECFAGHDCNGLSGLPKSGMLSRLADSHGLRHAIYVGDTVGDRDAAAEAGMEFVFARYGFGSLTGATLSFGSFGELAAHFVAGLSDETTARASAAHGGGDAG